MLRRYRTYIQARPIQGWLFSVIGVLGYSCVCYWVTPGTANARYSTVLTYACTAFVVPTFVLMMRLSGFGPQERPFPPNQEQNIATLSFLAGLCAIGALAVATFGRFAGWSQDTRVTWLMASFTAALVAAMLGYGVRQTRLGPWAMRLSASWAVLMVIYVLAMLVRQAVMHT